MFFLNLCIEIFPRELYYIEFFFGGGEVDLDYLHRVDVSMERDFFPR